MEIPKVACPHCRGENENGAWTMVCYECNGTGTVDDLSNLTPEDLEALMREAPEFKKYAEREIGNKLTAFFAKNALGNGIKWDSVGKPIPIINMSVSFIQSATWSMSVFDKSVI